MREVRVVKDQFLIDAELINRGAAAFALKEFQNLAAGSGEHGRFSSGGNIDRIVYATFRPRVVEGIEQLFGFDSGDGNDEIHRADKVRSRGCWGDWRRWRQWCSDRDRSFWRNTD